MSKLQNKYSLNRLFKVTYLDGRIEMICARGILDFVNKDSQYYIHSIEIVAVSSFVKDVEKEHNRNTRLDNYPSFIEYNIENN